MKHTKLWWVEKYIQLKLRRNRGNALTGELKGLWSAFTGGGILILLIDRYMGVLLPLWILGAAWLFQYIGEYFLGKLDQKVLHTWQAELEWIQRKGISPWAKEQMDMIREVHKKTCPDSKLKPKTYVKEE